MTLDSLDHLTGRYHFEREVGQGSTATVYLAQDDAGLVARAFTRASVVMTSSWGPRGTVATT